MSDVADGIDGAMPLAVTHQEETSVAIPVTPDPKALAKARQAERMAQARAYEQLGQKLLRLKTRKLGEVGHYIVERLGVKKVGHGTIAAASDKADEYMTECADIVQELRAKDPPCDPEVIVAMMQLIRDFTRLMLDSGKEHIAADRQPSIPTEGDKISVPFPPGTPLMIGVKPQAPREVSDSPHPIEPPESPV